MKGHSQHLEPRSKKRRRQWASLLRVGTTGQRRWLLAIRRSSRCWSAAIRSKLTANPSGPSRCSPSSPQSAWRYPSSFQCWEAEPTMSAIHCKPSRWSWKTSWRCECRWSMKSGWPKATPSRRRSCWTCGSVKLRKRVSEKARQERGPKNGPCRRQWRFRSAVSVVSLTSRLVGGRITLTMMILPTTAPPIYHHILLLGSGAGATTADFFDRLLFLLEVLLVRTGFSS